MRNWELTRLTHHIKKWLVLTIVVLSILGMNVYRLFPVSDEPPKLGDKVYYYINSFVWILVIQALRLRKNDHKDRIILGGFLSLAINQFIFEFIGDPTKINWQHFLIATIVTISVCWQLKLRWWMISIILVSIFGLLLI